MAVFFMNRSLCEYQLITQKKHRSAYSLGRRPTMQHCASCGWEPPGDARFCGHCGQGANATIGESFTRDILSSNAPTPISGPSHPHLNRGADQEQLPSTLSY